MGAAVPSKRLHIFKACAKWWTHSDSIMELSRASTALEHWGSEMGDPNSPAERSLPPNDVLQRKILLSIVRFVPEVDRTILDAEVTASDLASAIRHTRATSAPGMDGLSAGFYQVAPDVFGDCLSIVFKDRHIRGVLLPSQRNSADVLLHKKGSRAEPGNYRPIALVPVDVKVLSKALTHRLQSVIPDLIHPDQKGFVKGDQSTTTCGPSWIFKTWQPVETKKRMRSSWTSRKVSTA
ncbi:hypothetical protein PsorP6_011983 [Peronosclerospora sorghi]|uniref:Uncharacterized protein n=1 Tax=Peronosclerospora sorghi TaxID=230839 RepID=A0ACC0WMI2_9STRA|nr:hypothetical protein PsorP6_011983 [Peronosclerospora sorghi]